MDNLKKKQSSIKSEHSKTKYTLKTSLKSTSKVMPKMKFKEQKYLEKISMKIEGEENI